MRRLLYAWGSWGNSCQPKALHSSSLCTLRWGGWGPVLRPLRLLRPNQMHQIAFLEFEHSVSHSFWHSFSHSTINAIWCETCNPPVLLCILASGFASPNSCLWVHWEKSNLVPFLPFLYCHWSISAAVSVVILSVVFPHYSHVFVTCREHGLPFPLIRSYALPFACPFYRKTVR